MSIIEKALDKLDKPEHSEDKKSAGDSQAPSKLAKEAKPEASDTKIQTDNKRSKSITLDLEQLGKQGYLTPTSENKILFEQYRRVKLPILKTAFESDSDRNKNILMVTSSVTGEGKSFTSMNLAMSIAYEYNYTVLLIDGDITKKMSSKVFGTTGSNGLIEYLTDKEKNLENLILKTNIEKLNLIPSGSNSERVTELFASNKMTNLINEISNRYNDRLIIIDTPPVLEDSSAKVLSELADQVLYVIEAEKTPKHIVEQGLKILGRDTDIGIILNKSNLRHNPSYYYV